MSDDKAKDAPPAASPEPAGPNSARLSDPERWLEDYGDYLFKYALLRLRGVAKAEDEEPDRFVQGGLFKGGWIHELGPAEWSPDPGASLDNEAFWKTFHDCAAKLPKNINAAFCLREIDDTDTGEICRALDVSENNLWVMLHRARMALRRCLETNWFGKSQTTGKLDK